jgi:hypothetical protein
MSCCNRTTAPAPPRWPAPQPAVDPIVSPEAPLRFTGAHALSLPVGARRVLVTPGRVVEGLTPAERALLVKTGLFD